MFVTFIIADTVDYIPEMRQYTTQRNGKPTEKPRNLEENTMNEQIKKLL